MALVVRKLTVATTVEDVEAHVPGGWSQLHDRQPRAVRVGQLVRLEAVIPGLPCGVWSCCRGAYVVELAPHPDIVVLTGRRRKSAGLAHRTVRLKAVAALRVLQPKPQPPRRPPSPQPTVAVSPPPPQPASPTAASPPAASKVPTHERSADDLLQTHGVLPGRAPFEVGGQTVEARALRIALWLRLKQNVPIAELHARHLALLPPDGFEVDGTAAIWEMRFRVGAMASGLGNSVHYPKVRIMSEIGRILDEKNLTRVFGTHRWPHEAVPGACA